jgi:hypothetical protein
VKSISLQRIAQLIGFAIVIAGLPFEPHVARAQFPSAPFPVLQIDSVVRARLIEEWQPDNRYQHERGYCVRYVTEQLPATFWRGAIVVYTLVEIVRGVEGATTESSIRSIGCPDLPDVTYLHVHPPYFCSEHENAGSCSKWDQLAHQCFPSPTDVGSLQRSKRPFDLVQCDQWAVVPYWRPSA